MMQKLMAVIIKFALENAISINAFPPGFIPPPP